MIADNKITISLDKTTLQKLKMLKQFKNIDNMTTYCKKVLSNSINTDFKQFQEKVSK